MSLSRTAWGLSTPDRRDTDTWWHRAACASTQVDPDWWTGDPVKGGGTTRALARHLCVRHCSVLTECRTMRDRDPDRYAGTVIAGDYLAYDLGHARNVTTLQPAIWACSGAHCTWNPNDETETGITP